MNEVSNGNESNFFAIDNGIILINQIVSKIREEDKDFAINAQDPFTLPVKIEVADSPNIKNSKRIFFTDGSVEIREVALNKKEEVIRLVEELQRKRAEFINQNNKKNNNSTSDNNQNLPELRKKIISIVNNALHNQEPKISTNELEPNNRN
ncbi:MAG: hypothetical protein NY202_05085 [Mollicutes bacterium UO1]